MFKVSTEVMYMFNFTPNTPNPTFVDGNYDGKTFVEQGSTFSPGIFGGIKHRLSRDVGFEMTLRNFGMRTYEYTPATYSGKDPSKYGKKEFGKSSAGTSRGWALEFALTVKL
jgi:hypothetical protein